MKQQEFKEGIRDGIPICLGYLSVSMAFGLTAVKAGIPVWATLLISMTNLTSAGQFAGTTLLVAQGLLDDPNHELRSLLVNLIVRIVQVL